MDKSLIDKAKGTDISVLNLKFKKEGNYYRSEEHSSLLFKIGKNGFWVYDWNSQQSKGDIIKFVMEYYSKSFVEAVEFLTGENTNVSINIETLTHKQEQKQLQMPSKANNMHRAIAYLNKTRKIKQATIQYLIDKKLMYQDNKGNCVFVWRDLEGKEIGAELNGTLTSKRFKGIAPGSAWGHGFNIKSGTVETIYFFESTIDLLSFTNLQKCSNCILISMAGLKKEVVFNYIKLYKDSEIVMCVDNDSAADEFIKINNFDKYKRMIPKSKDFNEDLKMLKSTMHNS